MRAQRAVLVMLLSLSAGCGVEVVRKTQPVERLLSDPSGVAAVSLGSDGEQRFSVGGTSRLSPVADAEFDRMSLHPRVLSQADKLSRGQRATVRDALERSGRYIGIIERELAREGVPGELAFLPAVESHFSTTAEGRGTVGLWQFTRGTARLYGLRVDAQVDERRDPELASRAAARMLRDLYDQFGRWGLVLAAYNAGPGRVQQALAKSPGADFWRLADKGMLPARTRSYVPKVLLVAAMASRPETFGLDDVRPLEPLSYEKFEVAEALDVKTIASLSGASRRTIEELNPSLRSGMVPRTAAGFEIRLPAGTRDRFAAGYRQRAASR